MRILHCCLSNFYIDGFNYQENALPRQHKADGHDVMILASTEIFEDSGVIGYTSPSRYENEDGISVIRIPYLPMIPFRIARKIRAYKDTYKYVSDFQPDVILFHGSGAFDVMTIAKYIKANPSTRFYVDNHADYHNSARNAFSREVLHKALYKPFLHSALPYIKKVLCISLECLDFMRELYAVPESKLELFPLGGHVWDDNDYYRKRFQVRNALDLAEDDILFVHSGKLNEQKRTVDLLTAFKKVASARLRLVLLGSLASDYRREVVQLINSDQRISFLGWKSFDELQDFLCAADMYLQPGSQSATMQNALCCRCAVMLYPHKSHAMYLKDNGFFVETVTDMESVFNAFDRNSVQIKDMSNASYKIALRILDYRKLAARVY